MIDADELTALVQQALPGAVVLVEDRTGRGDVRLTIVAREFATTAADAEPRVRTALAPALAGGRLRSAEVRG